MTTSIDRIGARARTEKLFKIRPAKSGVAEFLLDDFIKIHFPYGNIWTKPSISQLPQSVGETEAFLEFLKQPDEIRHPYTDTWLNGLNPTTSGVNSLVLAHKLKVLHETRQERVQKWATTTKKLVCGTSGSG